MSKTWLEPEEITPPPDLVQAVDGHPLVAKTLARRGITDPDAARAFLDPDYYRPSPPDDLPGLLRAVERINRAIEAQETILVWGDFDVDGQTSTTLLVEALYNIGAQVVYHIPVRETEGHGIQPEVLEALIVPGPPHPNPFPPVRTVAASNSVPIPPAPALLLTCDTGIAEHSAVELAHSLGLDVIITDHHELPAQLPPAEAILNPHLLPAGHQLSSLPGVGVAYVLVEGLYQSRGLGEEVKQYLDLVALGIVADVAEQVGDTRYLLQRGLRILRENNRPGLAALLQIAKIPPLNLDESHIGFSIGPSLNALGRLGDANQALEFFTTQESQRAEYLAMKLDNLNLERRMHTERVYRGVMDLIRFEPGLQDYSALVLAQPGWPTGVIGIVASRLVERFGKPTVLLNIDEDGIARGSARSVEGVNLVKAIEAQADLLIHYGGHAGAAGLSLEEANLPEFRSRLSRTVKSMTAHLDLIPTVTLDAILPLAEVDLDLVDDLRRLGPFGAGNPQPVLASCGLKLVSETRVGRESEHLRLVVEDHEGNAQELLWWRGAGEPKPGREDIFDLVYHASSTTFQGVRQLQLEWVDYRLREELLKESRSARPKIDLIDYRDYPDPLRLLKALSSREKVQVWAEGAGRKEIYGQDRDQLQEADSLVIWTTPPNHPILLEVLQRVDPKAIYIFALHPQVDGLGTFLKRLLGLVKTVINRQGGEITLRKLAAAMAHSEDTVKIGLRTLQAKGLIQLAIVSSSADVEGDQETAKVSWREQKIEQEDGELDQILISILAETAAFREYFRHADLDALFDFKF